MPINVNDTTKLFLLQVFLNKNNFSALFLRFSAHFARLECFSHATIINYSSYSSFLQEKFGQAIDM